MLEGERGVEPLVMKLMAGIILFAIGLGIGMTIYLRVGSSAGQALSFSVNVGADEVIIGGPAADENSKTVQVSVEKILGGYNKTVTLNATGVPDNVAVSFSSAGGAPDFGSTMTMKVGVNATLGCYDNG